MVNNDSSVHIICCSCIMQALSLMDEVFLSNSAYINGMSDVSVADLLAVCELEQPMISGLSQFVF